MNAISKCPVTGLERKVDVFKIMNDLKNKTCNLVIEVTRYKDNKELTAMGLGKFQANLIIENNKDGADYDSLILGKTEVKIIEDVIKWADKKGIFDK